MIHYDEYDASIGGLFVSFGTVLKKNLCLRNVDVRLGFILNKKRDSKLISTKMTFVDESHQEPTEEFFARCEKDQDNFKWWDNRYI